MILNRIPANAVIFITAESEAEPVTALCYRCLIKGCDIGCEVNNGIFSHQYYGDRGDHFKVVGLKIWPVQKKINVSVSPLELHLRATLFTASMNVT